MVENKEHLALAEDSASEGEGESSETFNIAEWIDRHYVPETQFGEVLSPSPPKTSSPQPSSPSSDSTDSTDIISVLMDGPKSKPEVPQKDVLDELMFGPPSSFQIKPKKTSKTNKKTLQYMYLL